MNKKLSFAPIIENEADPPPAPVNYPANNPKPTLNNPAAATANSTTHSPSSHSTTVTFSVANGNADASAAAAATAAPRAVRNHHPPPKLSHSPTTINEEEEENKTTTTTMTMTTTKKEESGGVATVKVEAEAKTPEAESSLRCRNEFLAAAATKNSRVLAENSRVVELSSPGDLSIVMDLENVSTHEYR